MNNKSTKKGYFCPYFIHFLYFIFSKNFQMFKAYFVLMHFLVSSKQFFNILFFNIINLFSYLRFTSYHSPANG
jgi:hypothetical protein